MHQRAYELRFQALRHQASRRRSQADKRKHEGPHHAIAWVVTAQNLADRTILRSIAWILGLLLLAQLLGSASPVCKAMSPAADDERPMCAQPSATNAGAVQYPHERANLRKMG